MKYAEKLADKASGKISEKSSKNDTEKIPLILSEITALWDEYMNDMASVYVFKHFLTNVEDKEIGDVIEHALKLSENHIKEKTELLNHNKQPIPIAFSDEDIDYKAPRLFTDQYYLYFINHMSGFGIELYGLVMRYVTRPDIREYFSRCIFESTNLFNKAVDVQMSKGYMEKVPREEVEQKPIFPKGDMLFKGLLTDNPRPMFAKEVVNTFGGSIMNEFLRATSTGFAQVAKLPSVKDYMLRGRRLFSKHFQGFTSKLQNEGLPAPSTSDSYVTASTTAPFSDKLMLFMLQEICLFGMVVDTSSTIFDLRTDLLALHVRYGAELGKYVKDGTKIMLDNGWFEQPPQVIRHEKLIEV